MRILRIFRLGERGATAIEYGLIAALIAVVAVAAIGRVGGKLQNTFGNVANGFR